MPITLITGVPGTGKTAYIVAELEKIAATGRKIFVSGIPHLKIEHYKAGKVTEWQKGTWLHIDQYKRPDVLSMASMPDDEDDDTGNENWIPQQHEESHKGALIVIDECQRYFRPRPQGSAVPDHVAALEVHRHQGLDIWLVTQRPGLVDSNVRALCGKHIALRSTSLGRFKYEWPEVGDIDSKASRDVAAKSRYKLPKHVFQLYQSAEVHTKHSHKMTLAAKALFVAIPILAFLIYRSYSIVTGKFTQAEQMRQHAAEPAKPIQHAKHEAPIASTAAPSLPAGFEPYSAKEVPHRAPFQDVQFSIVARLKSATKDVYRFDAMNNGQHAFYLSSSDLETAGYIVFPINDCSAKLVYKEHESFVNCNVQSAQQVSFQAPVVPVMQAP